MLFPLISGAMALGTGVSMANTFAPGALGGVPFLGRERGKQGINTAAMSGLQGATYGGFQAADELNQMRMFADSLDAMENMAVQERSLQGGMGRAMGDELQSLIANRQHAISRIAEAPMSTQQALIDMAKSGGF